MNQTQVKPNRDTQGVMLVQMALDFALDFALRHDMLSLVVFDAFFSIGAVFELANSAAIPGG